MSATGSSPDSRVIGFFALDGDRLLLKNGACIVTGTEDQMQALVSQLPEQARRTPAGDRLDFRARKIRYGSIVEGMTGGGAYAFDRQAYEEFRVIANDNGFGLSAFDLADPDQSSVTAGDSSSGTQSTEEETAQGMELVTLQLDR
ncbi:MAG: hypothetical protein KTR33_14740 [Gammaproteobacteria bacterium]|nr:hypothetical protein [Gammaproteobacteria bacterium]